MSNISGGINSDNLTSTAVVSSQITNYITSASASALISTLTANFITSASASTLSQGITRGYVASVQRPTPVDGATVTVDPGTDIVYVSTNALGSVQITLATAGVTTNKQLRIASKSAITSVNLGGATVVGAITAIAANGSALYIYDGTNWVRIG